MSDRFYAFLRAAGRPWRYACAGAENLRTPGGALVAANHLGALGPIQCVLSLPRRLHPWIVADMLDPQRIAAYLYQDFVAAALHLRGAPGRAFAAALAPIVLRLLRGLDGVAVDRGDVRFLGAFRRSMALLQQGRALLIFAEDPRTPLDAESSMRAFMSGFAWLCTLYRRSSGEDLPVIPAAVCPRQRRVYVGAPLYYVESGQRRADMAALAERVQNAVRRLYLQAQTPPQD